LVGKDFVHLRSPMYRHRAKEPGYDHGSEEPWWCGESASAARVAHLGSGGDLACADGAFGCALACVVGAARLLYALSRDEVGPAPLGTVSPRNGAPVRSTATIAVAAYVIVLLGWFVFGVAPFDLFLASGTIGTLILLLVYALATIGAARLLFFSGERQVAAWEVVVPFLALVVIGYTLFRNVVPYPTDAAAWYPLIAALWVVAGVVLTFVRNAATRRAGERLMAEEGLAAEPGSRSGG
jgi:amino acid transporter